MGFVPRADDWPASGVAADRILLAVGGKETDHQLRLLEGLNQTVEQDPIEAPIAKTYSPGFGMLRRVTWLADSRVFSV